MILDYNIICIFVSYGKILTKKLHNFTFRNFNLIAAEIFSAYLLCSLLIKNLR
jgi:hypothetical protein